MLTFSTFLAVACDGSNEINSVGGPVTDGNNLAQTNSGLSASSGLVGTDCITLPPMTVTGFVYFSIPRLAVGITYVLNSGGGGGGGDTTVQADSTLGCDGAGDAKFLHANAVFQAAKASAGAMGIVAFMNKYKAGSTFKVLYPDGTIGRWVVSNPRFTHPFSHERSCG